jgi:hypothetical protein
LQFYSGPVIGIIICGDLSNSDRVIEFRLQFGIEFKFNLKRTRTHLYHGLDRLNQLPQAILFSAISSTMRQLQPAADDLLPCDIREYFSVVREHIFSCIIEADGLYLISPASYLRSITAHAPGPLKEHVIATFEPQTIKPFKVYKRRHRALTAVCQQRMLSWHFSWTAT